MFHLTSTDRTQTQVMVRNSTILEVHITFTCTTAYPNRPLWSLITRYISANRQVADIITKALSRQHFVKLRSKADRWVPSRPSLRGRIDGDP